MSDRNSPVRPTMTPFEFYMKWTGSRRGEIAASQEHFIDLCRMVGARTPNEADPTGDWYAFQKGAEKTSGGEGWADVWKRGCFAWEYKGKKKSLHEAYVQLQDYRESLENPPILVVSDMDRFEVHTNFTGTKPVVYHFKLDGFVTEPERVLDILRSVMLQPEKLHPTESPEEVTERAADRFAEVARKLHARGHAPQDVAHFLNKLVFCFFAEGVGLLSHGLLNRLLENLGRKPWLVERQLRELFRAMSFKGGLFGPEEIEWFDGGLFDADHVLPLKDDEIAIVKEASELDWSRVEPAILGTLFERGLDPTKRKQLGAHYTDVDAIRDVVIPVVIDPLRREFDAMKDRVLSLVAAGRRPNPRAKPENDPERVFKAFLDRLAAVRVLDPACGSGNFLYVALREIKDIEQEAIQWAYKTLKGHEREFPRVGPQIVHGIEINPYAAELAHVAVWIGHIQWLNENGYGYSARPVLEKLKTIEYRDAILDRTNPKNPRLARWPSAEFIIGNPPFAGGKKLRSALGDEYVDALFKAWEGRVPREADYVCYWHEKARDLIAKGKARRAGLLATQGIRGGANRKVLQRIKKTGDIFAAWSDRPWVLDGANVRVSIICQDDGSETERRLDGTSVRAVRADLTGDSGDGVDLTSARPLAENAGLAFMGDTKGGPFDLPGDDGRRMLLAGGNPNGRPNSDVVVPWINGLDVTRRARGQFIIDFGVGMQEREAALYEAPFEWVREHVAPARAKNKRPSYRERWWLHAEPRPALRAAVATLPRFMVTAMLAKHRIFAWCSSPTLPDHQLVVIARADDFAFGVLHSRVHDAWGLRKATRHGHGDTPRYTLTTTFETFPFPWALGTPEGAHTPAQRAAGDAVAATARALDEARNRWLNPPDLVCEEPDVLSHLPPRRIPRDEAAAREIKKRTLTSLYNTRPAWLDGLHRDLDRAVLLAYGWSDDPGPEEVLRRLLDLNLQRRPA